MSRIASKVASLILTGVLIVANAQADDENLRRGAEVYQSRCAMCHLPMDMEIRMRDTWAGRTADDLYQKIKVTMPGEQPGALEDQQYLDVVTYVLKLGHVALPSKPIHAGDLASVAIAPRALAENAAANRNVDWPVINGDLAATRFADLDQINAGNVKQLQIAWRFPAAIFGPTPEGSNSASPIVANGTMYATAGDTRNVVAIDPGKGQIRWMWRPQEGQRFNDAPRPGSGRGVSYWRDGAEERILTVTPGYFLVSLNAKTGVPDASFGRGGWVDLKQGLRLGQGRDDIDIGLNFPPLVVNDVVIVGASHDVGFRPPSKSNVKGDVRGFDVRSGKLLWTFKTIPEPGVWRTNWTSISDFCRSVRGRRTS